MHYGCSSTVIHQGLQILLPFIPPALSQLLALSYCCLFLLAAAHSQLFALTHCSLFCLCRSLGAVALTRCCLFSLVASLTESCRSPEKDSYDQLLSLVHPLTCGSSSNTQLTEYEVRSITRQCMASSPVRAASCATHPIDHIEPKYAIARPTNNLQPAQHAQHQLERFLIESPFWSAFTERFVANVPADSWDAEGSDAGDKHPERRSSCKGTPRRNHRQRR